MKGRPSHLKSSDPSETREIAWCGWVAYSLPHERRPARVWRTERDGVVDGEAVIVVTLVTVIVVPIAVIIVPVALHHFLDGIKNILAPFRDFVVEGHPRENSLEELLPIFLVSLSASSSLNFFTMRSKASRIAKSGCFTTAVAVNRAILVFSMHFAGTPVQQPIVALVGVAGGVRIFGEVDVGGFIGWFVALDLRVGADDALADIAVIDVHEVFFVAIFLEHSSDPSGAAALR